MSKKDGVFVFLSIAFGVVMLSACHTNEILQTPESSCSYELPWAGLHGQVEVSQGSRNRPTHMEGEFMEHAIDFSLPEGAIILAAREGGVSHVQGEKIACGGEDLINEGNYVVIDHGDGTSALYLHLQSVTVAKDQEVQQGQLIGYSGKTGWTECNPHLHFQVQETSGIWFSKSTSVCFDNVFDNEGVPYRGMILAPGDEIMKISGEVISAITEPGPLDLTDPHSVAQWTIYAVMTNHPEIFENLVGPHGATFAPYGTGFDFAGYDNGKEIAQAIKDVLAESSPECLGYKLDLSDNNKLSVLVDGIDLNAATEYGSKERGIVKFHFFRFEGVYELVVIGHVYEWGIEYETSDLISCSYDKTKTTTADNVLSLIGSWEGSVYSVGEGWSETQIKQFEINENCNSGEMCLYIPWMQGTNTFSQVETPNWAELENPVYCFGEYIKIVEESLVNWFCFHPINQDTLEHEGGGGLWYEEGTLNKVGQNYTPDMGKPTILLNPKDADSVLRWLSYALSHNDISVFEQLLTDSGISYGTGFAGGRYNITKHEFLEMLKKRLVNKVVCRGYSGNNDHLLMWTSGWSPDWDDNQSYGAPWSSDELVFSFSDTTQGLSLISAYSTPSSAILGSPSVESESCPTN